MPFMTLLTDLVTTVPGASGAILADWEGEAVAQYYLQDDDYELKVLGAHKGIILNQMREIHASLGSGELNEAVITTACQHVLIGTIGPDYNLVMTLDRTALIGYALHHFRRTLERLREEIC